MSNRYNLLKKSILIIGIISSTYGGMIQNDTILLIGGVVSIVGTMMIALLR